LKIGLALVDVPRFRRLREKYPERLLKRCFTEDERLYAFRHKDPDSHLAGRLAAKFALRKVLEQSLSLQKVGVVREQGAPCFQSLDGHLFEHLQLSISHTQELAIAQVLVEDA
jgi:phosphopantetheine--protein transferase-like protein